MLQSAVHLLRCLLIGFCLKRISSTSIIALGCCFHMFFDTDAAVLRCDLFTGG